MSSTPPFYIGYTDGANRSSQNVAFVAWFIFSPINELLDSGGILLSHDTNNLAEYEVVIDPMANASTLGIFSLVVWLDSKLVIS